MKFLNNATHRSLRIFALIIISCMAMGALCSCSTLAPIAGAGTGAAVGSLFGPGGAALGGAAGAAGGELVYPPEQIAAPPPETIWGLLSKLIDQAAWLAIVAGLLYVVTLFAPPPKEWFKRK